MIADKIIPSFYVIEVRGIAVESIIPGGFGIDKIELSSHDFTNDMYATAALSTAMEAIVLNPALDVKSATEKLEYNPEFFPMFTAPELTEEQKDIMEALQAQADEASIELAKTDQIAVPIPKLFDSLGDFVESRWSVESPEFKILGRVVANPDKYVHYKAIEISEKAAVVPRLEKFSLH